LDKVEPWNVDVGKLVVGVLYEMKRMGNIDFRVSGNALYSASVIFMRKTRDLVQLGILPPEDNDDEEELEIPLIRPPFRLTNRRVTIEELLIAMDQMLNKGTRTRNTPTKHLAKTKADPITFTMNIDQANIEETIAEVYSDLQRLLKVEESSQFTDILMNNTRKEIVRVFFAILFLFARKFIDMWMDEDLIWIKMIEPPEVEEEEAEKAEPVIKS
jgi:chromatin segregation and condensation protein Rec8/ScpA/Scc1 (kleisin family)